MAEVIEKTETTQKQNVKTPEQVIESLENNDFNIYFFTPPMEVPSGGIGVLLKQALILKEAGYNVKLLYQPNPDQRATVQYRQAQSQRGVEDKSTIIYHRYKPTWMEFNLFETVEDEKMRTIQLLENELGEAVAKLDGLEKMDSDKLIQLSDENKNLLIQLEAVEQNNWKKSMPSKKI